MTASASTKQDNYTACVAAGDPIIDAVGVHERKEPVAGPSGESDSGSRPRRGSANSPVY